MRLRYHPEAQTQRYALLVFVSFFCWRGMFIMMLLVVMVMVVVNICDIGELTDVWNIYLYFFKIYNFEFCF